MLTFQGPIATTSNNLTMYNQKKNYLWNTDNFGSLMLAVVIDTLGSDFLNYKESETSSVSGFSLKTVIMDLEDIFKDKLPLVNINKLGAAINALKSNRFYVFPTSFNVICRGLTGEGVDCDYSTCLDVEDMLFSMWEVQKLNPPRSINNSYIGYSIPVIKYIYITLGNNGIQNIPRFLNINEKYYAKVKNLIDFSALELDDIDKESIQKYREENDNTIAENLNSTIKDFNEQLNTLPIAKSV